LANGFDGVCETAEIFEIEIEEIGIFGEQSFGLGWIAAQNRNLRLGYVISTFGPLKPSPTQARLLLRR